MILIDDVFVSLSKLNDRDKETLDSFIRSYGETYFAADPGLDTVFVEPRHIFKTIAWAVLVGMTTGERGFIDTIYAHCGVNDTPNDEHIPLTDMTQCTHYYDRVLIKSMSELDYAACGTVPWAEAKLLDYFREELAAHTGLVGLLHSIFPGRWVKLLGDNIENAVLYREPI